MVVLRTRASWAAFVLAVAAIALTGLWWVTSGNFRLLEPVGYPGVYEAQARSFLSGRTDIACGVASGEAFMRNGKCYSYFGPVPALLRLPMLWLAPELDGRWARLMVLVAGLLFLAAVGLILVEAGHPLGSWTSTFYLLLTAFGSTLPYVWSWPAIFPEAIAWAVAFGSASIYCQVKWVWRGGAQWIVGACLFAISAFFSRVSTGAGPMLAVGLMALAGLGVLKMRDRGGSAYTIGLLGLAAGLFMALNQSRMGTYLDAMPVRLNVQYDAERMARIGGTVFHPEKSLYLLLDYLAHLPRFRSSYPWLEYGPGALFDLPGMDFVDLHAGVLATMPALVWLAWAGWRGSRGKPELWPLLSPVVGVALLVTTVVVTQRYVHEFVLLLAPAGAFGLTWALATRFRRCVTYALSAWSIYACWAVALVGQREVLYWVSAEAIERHCTTRAGMDRLMGRHASVHLPGAGGRLRLPQTGGIYEFDGEKWQRCAGPPAHHFSIRFRFNSLPVTPFRILVIGRVPEADTITLEPASALGRYRVRMDHPELPGELSGEFELAPQRDYLLECQLERMQRRLSVKLDGAVIGKRKTGLVQWIETEVTVGSPGQWIPD